MSIPGGPGGAGDFRPKCGGCGGAVPCRNRLCRNGPKPKPPTPPPASQTPSKPPNAVIDTTDKDGVNKGTNRKSQLKLGQSANCRNCGPVNAVPKPAPKPVGKPIGASFQQIREETARLQKAKASASGLSGQLLSVKMELNQKLMQLEGLAKRKPQMAEQIRGIIGQATGLKNQSQVLLEKSQNFGKVASNTLAKFVPRAVGRQVSGLAAAAAGPEAVAAAEIYQTGSNLVEGASIGGSLLGELSVIGPEAAALFSEYRSLLTVISKLTI